MYPQDVEARGRWEPQKLNALHRNVIRLAFTGRFTQAEIAQHLGVTKALVNAIVNSALGEAHLEYLHERLDEKALENLEEVIIDLQPIAVEVTKQIMLNGSSETNRLRAAQDILNRGGTGVNVGGGDSYGSKDKIEEIKKLARERRVLARRTTVEEIFEPNTGEEEDGS